MTALLDQPVTPADVIAALDVLREQHRARAAWCGGCRRRHIRGEQACGTSVHAIKIGGVQ